MFKSRKTRVLTWSGVGVGAAAAVAVAGVAFAAPAATSSQAPHVQAGALVNADATIVHSKGVKAVTGSGHVYCVEISNADVDLSRAIVAATPRDNAGSTIRAIAGGCAGGQGVQVATYGHTGNGLALGFYLAVL